MHLVGIVELRPVAASMKALPKRKGNAKIKELEAKRNVPQ